MDTLYKHKEVFSLRNEIGTCPNIEVEINMMDKSPFFIRPYHVKEEDKAFIDKEMKCLCYLGILTPNAPRGTDSSFQPAPTMTIVLFIVTALPHQAGL